MSWPNGVMQPPPITRLTKEVDKMKEENSRRSFFMRVAAALGVVAAAAGTKTLIARAIEPDGDAGAKYASDVAAQANAVKENQLVVMTDEEKQQRIDDLLKFHRQEIA